MKEEWPLHFLFETAANLADDTFFSSLPLNEMMAAQEELLKDIAQLAVEFYSPPETQ